MVGLLTATQRLQGASLLVLSNKTDIAGSMSDEEIRKASGVGLEVWGSLTVSPPGTCAGLNHDTQVDHRPM